MHCQWKHNIERDTVTYYPENENENHRPYQAATGSYVHTYCLQLRLSYWEYIPNHLLFLF